MEGIYSPLQKSFLEDVPLMEFTTLDSLACQVELPEAIQVPVIVSLVC